MFNLKRQRQFDKVKLVYGSHGNRDDGLCAMEVVAYLAGESHSDHPDCACPVLTGYTIRMNDAMTDEWRQRLKPYLPLLIESRDGREVERAELLAWRAVQVFLPLALDACQLPDLAHRFRAMSGRLDRAADAAYAAYGAASGSSARSRAVNTGQACSMHAARAAYAAHAAGAARAPHIGRAVEASDAADAAIALTRVLPAGEVWPLALEALDAALEIGADARAAQRKAPRPAELVAGR